MLKILQQLFYNLTKCVFELHLICKLGIKYGSYFGAFVMMWLNKFVQNATLEGAILAPISLTKICFKFPPYLHQKSANCK